MITLSNFKMKAGLFGLTSELFRPKVLSKTTTVHTH